MDRLRVAIVISCLAAGATHARAEYREEPVTGGGTITGSVRVVGEVPVLPPQPVFKSAEACGSTVPDERLLVGSKHELRNAVVSLANIKEGKPIPRDRPVTLNNLKCAFVPHVLTASVGQMLEIHNEDPMLHDAHARIGSRTIFNVGIPKGHTVRRPLAEPGLVHINCNVRHTWMHAYLFIAEHPYHVATDAAGQFTLDQVPPGTYTLSVWHELLGNVEREVTVESGKTAKVDIELQAVAAEAP